MAARQTEVPLTKAAQQIGSSWHRTWALMLRGELAGRQDENGRWQVSTKSIAAFLRNRQSAEGSPRAA